MTKSPLPCSVLWFFELLQYSEMLSDVLHMLMEEPKVLVVVAPEGVLPTPCTQVGFLSLTSFLDIPQSKSVAWPKSV